MRVAFRLEYVRYRRLRCAARCTNAQRNVCTNAAGTGSAIL